MAQNQVIVDYANRTREYHTRTATAHTNLAADVQTLKDKITELQNTPPVLDPADQTLLNEIEALAAGIATQAEALDNATPPPPPPVTP